MAGLTESMRDIASGEMPIDGTEEGAAPKHSPLFTSADQANSIAELCIHEKVAAAAEVIFSAHTDKTGGLANLKNALGAINRFNQSILRSIGLGTPLPQSALAIVASGADKDALVLLKAKAGAPGPPEVHVDTRLRLLDTQAANVVEVDGIKMCRLKSDFKVTKPDADKSPFSYRLQSLNADHESFGFKKDTTLYFDIIVNDDEAGKALCTILEQHVVTGDE